MPQVYIAISAKKRHFGGMLSCLVWAHKEVLENPKNIATVFRARPGEKEKRIIAEVTSNGITMIKGGRCEKTTQEDLNG